MKSINLSLVLAGLILASCAATGSGGHSGRAVERWQNFDRKQNDTHVIDSEKHSEVVFIRQDSAIGGGAINVFANGEYLASLLPSGYKKVPLCHGNNKLLGIHTNVTNRYLPKEYKGQIYDVPQGKTNYFFVERGADGEPTFRSVSEADVDFSRLREQTHTLARVDRTRDCSKAPQVIDKIVLQASALFKFDRSSYANMLPEGKKEIASAAAMIRQKSAIVDRVDVIGYTDPDGSVAYNEGLSKRRANSVRRALIKDGVPSDLIVTEGRGESNLVVSGCKAKHPRSGKARYRCNQPNRRVEIIFYGTRSGR